MKINQPVTDVEIPFPEDDVLGSKTDAEGVFAYANPARPVHSGQCQYQRDDGRCHPTSNVYSIRADIIVPFLDPRIRFGRIESEIKRSPGIAGAAARRYLQAMVSLQQGIVVLIDIDKVLCRHELVEREAVVGG